MQNTQGSTLRADIMDTLREVNRNETLYIGMQAMPTWDVTRQKGVFNKLDVDNTIAKVGDAKVAPGSKFQRDQRTNTTDSYATVKYGGEEPIPIEDQAELDNYFDTEVDAAEALWAKARLALESDLASVLFDDTTTFASYKTDGTDWTTAASGTPICDGRKVVTKLKDQVKGFTGGARIVALANENTINNAMCCAEVRDALDYGGNGFANRDAFKVALANAWGVDAIYESVIRGADGNYVWAENKVGFYLVAEGQSLRSRPQVGRVVNWTTPNTYNEATEMDSADGIVVQSYFEEDCESEIIRVKSYRQVKLLNARAGHILYGLDS